MRAIIEELPLQPLTQKERPEKDVTVNQETKTSKERTASVVGDRKKEDPLNDLQVAVAEGDWKKVSRLLDLPPTSETDEGIEGETALQIIIKYAPEQSRKKFVKVLCRENPKAFLDLFPLEKMSEIDELSIVAFDNDIFPYSTWHERLEQIKKGQYPNINPFSDLLFILKAAEAFRMGRWEFLENLIAMVSLDCINQPIFEENNTLLHKAVETSNNDLIRLLMEKKANFTLCNRAGRTPLETSISGPLSVGKIFDYLPILTIDEKSSEVKKAYADALIYAAKKNNEVTVITLVRKGASLEHFDEQGYSALHYAVLNNAVCSNIVKNAKKKVNDEKEENIEDKDECQDLGMIKYLLNAGMSVNANAGENFPTPLMLAMRKDVTLRTVQLLCWDLTNIRLRNNELLDPNRDDGYKTPLMEAIAVGDLEKVKLLLGTRIDIGKETVKGGSALKMVGVFLNEQEGANKIADHKSQDYTTKPHYKEICRLLKSCYEFYQSYKLLMDNPDKVLPFVDFDEKHYGIILDYLENLKGLYFKEVQKEVIDRVIEVVTWYQACRKDDRTNDHFPIDKEAFNDLNKLNALMKRVNDFFQVAIPHRASKFPGLRKMRRVVYALWKGVIKNIADDNLRLKYLDEALNLVFFKYTHLKVKIKLLGKESEFGKNSKYVNDILAIKRGEEGFIKAKKLEVFNKEEKQLVPYNSLSVVVSNSDGGQIQKERLALEALKAFSKKIDEVTKLNPDLPQAEEKDFPHESELRWRSEFLKLAEKSINEENYQDLRFILGPAVAAHKEKQPAELFRLNMQIERHHARRAFFTKAIELIKSYAETYQIIRHQQKIFEIYSEKMIKPALLDIEGEIEGHKEQIKTLIQQKEKLSQDVKSIEAEYQYALNAPQERLRLNTEITECQKQLDAIGKELIDEVAKKAIPVAGKAINPNDIINAARLAEDKQIKLNYKIQDLQNELKQLPDAEPVKALYDAKITNLDLKIAALEQKIAAPFKIARSNIDQIYRCKQFIDNFKDDDWQDSETNYIPLADRYPNEWKLFLEFKADPKYRNLFSSPKEFSLTLKQQESFMKRLRIDLNKYVKEGFEGARSLQDAFKENYKKTIEELVKINSLDRYLQEQKIEIQSDSNVFHHLKYLVELVNNFFQKDYIKKFNGIFPGFLKGLSLEVLLPSYNKDEIAFKKLKDKLKAPNLAINKEIKDYTNLLSFTLVTNRNKKDYLHYIQLFEKFIQDEAIAQKSIYSQIYELTFRASEKNYVQFITDIHGNTLMHMAFEKLAFLLIEETKPDANQKEIKAAIENCYQMIRLLYLHGCTPTRRNSAGEDALEYANKKYCEMQGGNILPLLPNWSLLKIDLEFQSSYSLVNEYLKNTLMEFIKYAEKLPSCIISQSIVNVVMKELRRKNITDLLSQYQPELQGQSYIILADVLQRLILFINEQRTNGVIKRLVDKLNESIQLLRKEQIPILTTSTGVDQVVAHHRLTLSSLSLMPIESKPTGQFDYQPSSPKVSLPPEIIQKQVEEVIELIQTNDQIFAAVTNTVSQTVTPPESPELPTYSVVSNITLFTPPKTPNGSPDGSPNETLEYKESKRSPQFRKQESLVNPIASS